jgi:hypothetical protein
MSDYTCEEVKQLATKVKVLATSLLGKHQIHEQQKSQVRLARV